MTKEDFDVEKVTHWNCPAETGVPLLTMPNIPLPLHGLPPRVLMGNATWDHVRKKCYYDAGYKCEICGIDFAEIKPRYAAHELYSYNYEEHEGVFERCIAICAKCHDFIHSGRLITMYANHNPMYPKSYLLEIVEKGFSLVHSYNEEHSEAPLRVYATFLDYLDHPALREEMLELIKKYDIKFYDDKTPRKKVWEDWHLIWGGRRYNTPYKSQSDWAEAMEKRNKQDSTVGLKDPFSGGVFDDIAAIVEKEEQSKIVTKIPGCKSGRLSKRSKNE